MNSNILNKIIIAITIIIVILTIILLSKSCSMESDTAQIELIGSEKIVLHQYDNYIEYGYKIVNKKNNDYNVKIDGKVNTSVIGNYNITYNLYNNKDKLLSSVTRKVFVFEDDLSTTNISLKGEATEYYFVGNYKDSGFIAYRNNQDISNTVVTNSNVDSSKQGRYTVEYYIQGTNSKKSVTREVYIIDLDVNKTILKSEHIIKLSINVSGYDHVVLPNEGINKNSNITYKYATGNLRNEYVFDIYLKTGSHKKYVIDKSELGVDSLSGTCTLSYGNKTTTVTMQMNDISKVSKFKVSGEEFTGTSKTINGYKSKVTVGAYNEAGQVTTITCTGTPPTNTPKPTIKPSESSSGKLEIHMFSAGNFYDDAILIRSDKATIFIDGGRGASSVVSYLKKLNINKIDYVIGSHTEYDHIDAQGDIIRNFQVSHVMYANDIRNCGCRCDTKDVSNVLSAINSKNTSIIIPRVPSTMTIGDMILYIIAPWSLGCNKNDNSLVFILKYGNNTFMFTGDSSTPLNSSQKLLESANQVGLSSLKVDVLKYPHHGNEYINSNTMSMLRPSIILVPNKSFGGYPTSQMSSIISQNGNGTIYELNNSSTGSIVLTSNGSNITVDMNANSSNYIR